MTEYLDRRAIAFGAVALAVAVLVNEYNVSVIRAFNPTNATQKNASLEEGQTIYNPDSYGHTTTAESLLAGEGWRVWPYVGNGSYFRRAPGTGLVYLFFRAFLGVRESLFAFKTFSLSLFFLSVICIYHISLRCHVDPRVAGLITLIYGYTPFFSSYSYYLLTESLSPYLMVFYLHFLMCARQAETSGERMTNYVAAGFFIGYAILTRPYVAIGGMLLPAFVLRDYSASIKGALKAAVVAGLLPFGLVLLWTARNYYNTREFVPLEKAYHPQSLDYMKPPVRGLLAFIKCWGENLSFGFHIYHPPLFYGALNADTSETHVRRVLEYWPAEVVTEFGHERLAALLRRYQGVVYGMRSYFANRVALPSEYSKEELAIEKEFDDLVTEYRRAHFWGYWLKTPLIYLSRMIFHSNTSNLLFFQRPFRGSVWLNAWRWSLAGLHIAAYVALFINMVILRDRLLRLVYVYFPSLVILFFVVIHREYEQRYMLPVLPYLIVGMGYPLRKPLEWAKDVMSGTKLL